MPISGFDFNKQPRPPTSPQLADAWRPYIETAIECFGASRCMFESNFPVDKAMFGYRAVWNAYKRLAGAASREDKAALFHRTAARVYRLELPDTEGPPYDIGRAAGREQGGKEREKPG